MCVVDRCGDRPARVRPPPQGPDRPDRAAVGAFLPGPQVLSCESESCWMKMDGFYTVTFL